MKNPKIAAKSPVKLSLNPGNYFWCSCGQSKNQPFCDGSHRGTDFNPTMFKIDDQKDVYLCRCKHSKNKPYCDGSHNEL